MTRKWQRAFLAMVALTCAGGEATIYNLTESRLAVARSPAVSTYQHSANPQSWYAWAVWLEYSPTNGGSSIWARNVQNGAPSGNPVNVNPRSILGTHYLSPAVVTMSDGSAWVFWVEVNPGSPSGGTLRARSVSSTGLGTPVTIESHAGYPTAALGANGRPWVFWEASRDQSGAAAAEIHCCFIDDNGQPSAPSALPGIDRPAYQPSAVLARNLAYVWVAWQSPVHTLAQAQYRNENSEVFLARVDGYGQWSNVLQLTHACKSDAAVSELPCAEGFTYLGHHVTPTVAAGGGGNAWVAWVAEGLGGGAGEQRYGYSGVQERRLQVCLVNDQLQQADIRTLPISIDDGGSAWPRLMALYGKVGVYYRRPDVDVPNDSRYRWNQMEQWGSTSTDLWLEADQLLPTIGAQEQGYGEPGAVARLDDASGAGVLIAWQADDHAAAKYSSPTATLNSDIWLERRPVPPGDPTLDGLGTPDYGTPMRYFVPRSNPVVQYQGEEFTLLFGDLHAHSSASWDSWAGDSEGEIFRREHDSVDLDFFAMTDHDEGLHIADWERQQALCAQHHDALGSTVLLGYEFTKQCVREAGTCTAYGTDCGHVNVLYPACSGPLRATSQYPNLQDLWAALQGVQAITIPHHSADNGHPADLNAFAEDPMPFATLFEIYQARGSFEWRDTCLTPECPSPDGFPCYDDECEAASSVGTCTGCGTWFCPPGALPPCPDPNCHCLVARAPTPIFPAEPFFGYYRHALALGYRMGAIASPDHGGFWGLAGVFTRSRSQSDVFEALAARRTFGLSSASARLALEFYGDGYIMGTLYERSSGACPSFSGNIVLDYPTFADDSTVRLADVRIYRVEVAGVGQYPTAPPDDGYVPVVLDGGPSTYTFKAEDDACPGVGVAAYYLRVEVVPDPDLTDADAKAFLYPNPGLPYPKDWRNHTLGWTSPVWVRWLE